MDTDATAERPLVQWTSQALLDVASERRRQIEVEGWSTEHDDLYIDCQLASAAACYAVCSEERHLKKLNYDGVRLWPWSLAWWKPSSYRRNLVKAAALLLSEIERLDRSTT